MSLHCAQTQRSDEVERDLIKYQPGTKYLYAVVPACTFNHLYNNGMVAEFIIYQESEYSECISSAIFL